MPAYRMFPEPGGLLIRGGNPQGELLLGEPRATRLASAAAGGVFTDQDPVAMAARTPAEILRWDRRLGSPQAGRYADLLVMSGIRSRASRRLGCVSGRSE